MTRHIQHATFRASDATEPKLLDDAIQRDEAVLRVSDAIEPKLLDDVIQRAEALRVSDAIEPKLFDDSIQRAEAVVSDAIEPKLFDDAIQRAEAVVRDWKFPADNLVEPEISFEYWKFSDEVSDVPSPNNFIQFIDDNPLPDDGGGLLINIQQTQAENVQQAPVKLAAPLTYAAPEILPTAASMVAAPQQYQSAPTTYAFDDEDDYQGYYDEDDYADSQDAGFLTPENEMVSWCASFDG